MINKVTLIGNLGKDAEIRTLENGVKVARFTLATNESYKDKAGQWQTLTEWHDIVAWRNLADYAEKNLQKGKMVYVDGKLTHRKYTDKDGKERYVTEVVANVIRLLEKRGESGPGQQGNSGGEIEEPFNSSSFGNGGEDDLPF